MSNIIYELIYIHFNTYIVFFPLPIIIYSVTFQSLFGHHIFLNKKININDLIFYNYNTNRPYSDVSLRKAFYKYCVLANVSKTRLYDLRHTYVALMMYKGKELYQISGRIKHSNYSTTVNKYGHLENKN